MNDRNPTSETTPLKPAYGAACNGCGACCIASLCAAAEAILDCGPPCPLLHWEFGRSWCGLVIMEQIAVARAPEMERLTAMSLGIGLGCSMEDGA